MQIKGEEPFVLYPVFAVELFDHQLRIGKGIDRFVSQVDGFFQSADQRHIFGDVIGGLANIVRNLQNDLVLAFNNYPDPGRTRISAGGAIGIYLHQHILYFTPWREWLSIVKYIEITD